LTRCSKLGTPTTITVVGVTSIPASPSTSTLVVSSTQGLVQLSSNAPSSIDSSSQPTSSSTSSATSRSGVSEGAGIGIGIGLGALAIAAAVVVIYYFRFRQRSIPPPTGASVSEAVGGGTSSSVMAEPKIEQEQSTPQELQARSIEPHRTTDTPLELP
jgi:galactitol-specific phosphotransferase system IIB component